MIMKKEKYFLILSMLIGLISCSDKEPQGEVSKFPTIGSIEKLEHALDAIVPENAKIEILAEGHEWTEGPVWVPALNSVLYSDIPRNSIYQWREGETASVPEIIHEMVRAVPMG
jgi:gluconolactonase